MNSCPIPSGSSCVAYLRDSGGSDQDLSIQEQTVALQRYCNEHKLALVQIYQDVASPGSTTIGRTNFIKMVDDLRASSQKIQAVIIWSFSRFSRDIDDSQYFKADLRRRGYIIHSLTDPVIEGLDGRLLEAAVEWSNAKYLDTLSTDVRRGLYHLVETYGAIPGTPPKGFIRTPINLGLRRDGDQHIVHRWEPDPDISPLILQAFQMRAAGSSYAAISQAVGLYTKKSAWFHFFENPIYKGELHYGSMVVPEYCSPLVPVELWNQVQSINTRPSRKNPSNSVRHPRRSSSNYILSGLLYCPCGGIMNGETIQTSKGYSSHYYYCYNKKRSYDTECKARRIPAAAIEKAIISEVADNFLTKDSLRYISDAIIENLGSQRDVLTAQKGEQINHREDTNQQINRITDAIAEHGHSQALLSRLRTLEQDAYSISQQISSIQAQITELDIRPTDEQLNMIIQQMRPAILTGERSRVRDILHQCIKRITAERVGSEIQVYLTYVNLTSMSRCPHGDSLC